MLFCETRLLEGILQEADLDLASSWDRENASVRHLEIHMITFPASLDSPSPDEGPDGLLTSNPSKLPAHILSSPRSTLGNYGPVEGRARWLPSQAPDSPLRLSGSSRHGTPEVYHTSPWGAKI